jgi:hypothetical protein
MIALDTGHDLRFRVRVSLRWREARRVTPQFQKQTEMQELILKLKKFLEPAAWLLSGIVIPIAILLWNFGLHPWIQSGEDALKSQIVSELSTKYDKQILTLTQGLETLRSVDIEKIKHKLVDEIDSTYYFTKTFTLSSAFKPASLDKSMVSQKADAKVTHNNKDIQQNEQDPMEQFFYAAPSDRVVLFVWATETHFDIEVKVNDGPSKKLAQVGAKDTRNDNRYDFGFRGTIA